MRSFVQPQRQGLQLFVGDTHQHVAPVILARECPHSGAEDVVFPAGRSRKKAAPAQRLSETEHTAAIDFKEFRQFAQRHRMLGAGDRLQDRQSAIEALDEWDVARLLWHAAFSLKCDGTVSQASPDSRGSVSAALPEASATYFASRCPAHPSPYH